MTWRKINGNIVELEHVTYNAGMVHGEDLLELMENGNISYRDIKTMQKIESKWIVQDMTTWCKSGRQNIIY